MPLEYMPPSCHQLQAFQAFLGVGRLVVEKPPGSRGVSGWPGCSPVDVGMCRKLSELGSTECFLEAVVKQLSAKSKGSASGRPAPHPLGRGLWWGRGILASPVVLLVTSLGAQQRPSLNASLHSKTELRRGREGDLAITKVYLDPNP